MDVDVSKLIQNPEMEGIRATMRSMQPLISYLRGVDHSDALATVGSERMGSLPLFRQKCVRTIRTKQTKILETCLLPQTAGQDDNYTLLTMCPKGTVIAVDLESGLRYDAIEVSDRNAMFISSHPSGRLFCCGGLSCNVDIYSTNTILSQKDYGPYPFKFYRDTSMHELLLNTRIGPNEVPEFNPDDEKVQGMHRYNFEDDYKDNKTLLESVTFKPRICQSKRLQTSKSRNVLPLHTSLMGHGGSVLCGSFLSDERLVSGSSDNNIMVWDLQTGMPSQLLCAHNTPVTQVSHITENSNCVLSTGEDGDIFLWDTRHNEPQLCMSAAGGGPITHLRPLPDKSSFAIVDRSEIGIYDIRSMHCVSSLMMGNREVGSLDLSPSGRLAAIGFSDGTLGLTDLAHTVSLGHFKAHKDFISGVHFDKGSLYTSSFDGTIKEWIQSSAR